MPEYLSPGVYVEEVSSGVRPIEGVGTSTGAFVGRAVKGPVDEPTLITNLTQFFDTFGGFHPQAFLAYAVRDFFQQGGTRCYVVRVFAPAGIDEDDDGEIDSRDDGLASVALPSSGAALTVQAASPGMWGNRLSVTVRQADFHPNRDDSTQFALEVSLRPDMASPPEPVETFGRLSITETTADGMPNPLYAVSAVSAASRFVRLEPPTAADPDDPPPLPSLPNRASSTLTGGDDGGTIDDERLIGLPALGNDSATGLNAFDTVDDINIVAIPDLMMLDEANARAGTLAALNYCESRGDCFFLADAPRGLSPQDVLGYKQGANPFNSTFGALYYPWIRVADPLTGNPLLTPPSGAVAGTYSGTDVRRGVHKSPAGTDDGRLRVALGLERQVTMGEQDTLNPNGINVIRRFPEAGIVIWGARTLSADAEWRYVAVRRLFLFLEESIDEGTQWTVFEPNGPTLWQQITRNVSAFLRLQWLDGRLAGTSPEEAFFVKCDEETNPQESVDAGRVVTLVGVAPLKPAEFVIFRISQTRPGAES